jgi:hypothetical protein
MKRSRNVSAVARPERRLRSTFLACLLAAAAAPLPASALGFTPPVSVQKCSVDGRDPSPITSYNPNPWFSGYVRLRFVNNTPVTATNIDLAISYDGEVEDLNSVGTFAPGARIERWVSLAPFVWPDDVTCSVVRIDFSDGTSWKRGSPGHATAPAH